MVHASPHTGRLGRQEIRGGVGAYYNRVTAAFQAKDCCELDLVVLPLLLGLHLAGYVLQLPQPGARGCAAAGGARRWRSAVTPPLPKPQQVPPEGLLLGDVPRCRCWRAAAIEYAIERLLGEVCVQFLRSTARWPNQAKAEVRTLELMLLSASN